MDMEAALLWGFLVLLLVVVATVIALMVHSGLFTSVVVKTCKPDIGEVHIAYKFARGPYKESGALFTQVHTLLPDYRTLGVYYDDPKVRQPQKLRYIVGIILAEGSDTTVVPEHRKLLEENGYQFATFPAIDHAVQTSFPFNSTISIIMAVMKVYPALREYIEARSLCARPFLEVYDNKRSEILFIGPLARQDDFYVPEVLQEEEDYRQDDYDDDARSDNSSRSWDESASFVREEGDRDGDERGGDSDASDLDDNTSTPAHPPPPPPPKLTPMLHHHHHPSPHATPSPSPASSYFSTSTPPPPSSPPPTMPEDTTTTTTTPIPAAATTTTAAQPTTATTTTTAATTTTSTPLLPPPAPEVVDADIGDTGSAGSEESDANTASSFEEIDEREAAAAAAAAAAVATTATTAANSDNGAAAAEGGQGEVREGSMRKDDDEGER